VKQLQSVLMKRSISLRSNCQFVDVHWFTGIISIHLDKIPSINWSETMSKEQKSNKETKKKPALSPKEKKAVKKSKKDSKD